MNKEKYFWILQSLIFGPALIGAICLLVPFSGSNYLYLAIHLVSAVLLIIYLQKVLLKPILQVEDVLQQILEDQHPTVPDMESPWSLIGKRLKSITFFLRISKRGMEDRVILLEESNRELEASNRQLRDEKLKTVDTLNMLQDVNQIQNELRGVLNTPDILAQGLQLAVAKLTASKGFVLQFDYEREQVMVECAFCTEALFQGQTFSFTEIQPFLNNLKVPLVSQYEFGGKKNQLYGENYQSLLVGAIITDETIDEIWGIVCLMDKEMRGGVKAFSNHDETMLKNIVFNVSKDLKGAHLFELATIDGLSKLYVRRYFERRMEEEIKRSQRHKFEMGLLIIDIDHFKRFNDNYGHLIGDEVIQIVSRDIKSTVRQEVDLVGRYGGEEIVVLLPQTDLENAHIVAERVRKGIAQLQIPSLPDTRVTVSIGIATFPNNGTEIKTLMQFADEGLYKAKESGRNKVCVAQVPQQIP